MSSPDHVRANRDLWDDTAHDWVAMGERAWAGTAPTWGIWGVPEANAEHVPVDDGSFDFAVNEYAAAIWCDPEAWVREAHRILRPGGRLVFLANHPLAMVCAPENGDIVADRLVRP